MRFFVGNIRKTSGTAATRDSLLLGDSERLSLRKRAAAAEPSQWS